MIQNRLLPEAEVSNTKRDYGPGRCQALQARQIALIVEITSAFNTTTHHDKLLWIMYDLGFPTDAIDVVNISIWKPVQTTITLRQENTQDPFRSKGLPYKETPLPLFFFNLYGTTSTVAPCRRKRI